jgi:hypothetical protein
MVDLGRVFEYRAAKKIRVKSVKLGIISALAFGTVSCYVVLYQILYKGRHLASAHPSGTARIQAQRPVKDHCNPLHPGCDADFSCRDKLPYCSQDGSDSVRGLDNHPCEYMDEHMMNPTKQQGTIFMPTRVTRQHQKPTGKCGLDAKSEECTNVYTFQDKGNTTYVADVERFTLLIDHAFTMPAKAITEGTPGFLSKIFKALTKRGSTVDFPGSWERCKDPGSLSGCHQVRIPCLPHHKCDGDDPDTISFYKGQVPGTVGLSVGDVIPLGELLKLAGIDLDKDRNREGEPWRRAGAAIQIDVDYENRVPFKADFWNAGELHYIYRVSRLPVEEYKTTSTRVLPNGDRHLYDTHGIFVYVNVQGEVAYSDVMQLQLVMATCATLLAIANAVVNSFAESMWKHKKTYQGVKYDTSVDLNHEDMCCFQQLTGADGDPDSIRLLHEKWDKDPQVFAHEFQSLDGEALRWAGMLIQEIHKDLHPAKKDEISTRAKDRHKLDDTPDSNEIDNTKSQEIRGGYTNLDVQGE